MRVHGPDDFVHRLGELARGEIDVIEILHGLRGIPAGIARGLAEQGDAGEACADMIELHTGAFANATGEAVQIELDRLIVAAKQAHGSVQVNAGHGINYTNIAGILTIPHLAELNIGHSIIARSTRVGLTTAVREMKELMAAYTA